MVEFIVAVLVGVACIGLGVANMCGHIGTLHSYHRHRVSEADRLPFGRLVGLGTVLIGVGVVALGACSIATLKTGEQIYMTVGGIAMGVLLAVGLALSFYAMIKYNKGIF